MEKIVLIIGLIFICLSIGAQEKKETIPTDSIFYEPEVMPQFPKGEQAMMKFISNNLRHPPEASEICIQGRVVVRFLVTKTGAIKDAKILRGVHPAYDKEALRVVNNMPDWNPGKRNDENVDVYFTLPIMFGYK